MDCNVIKDLLPLYVDECCSAESARLVADHLAVCEGCRRVHRRMCESGGASVEAPETVRCHRVSGWRASLLQSVMLFISFAVMTLGVILEGSTPSGDENGLWAVALIVPAAGYLLSLGNWFFLRAYQSRKRFSVGSCLVTLGLILLGYIWAALHYGGGLSAGIWAGGALSLLFCGVSKVLSDQYARLLGKE